MDDNPIRVETLRNGPVQTGFSVEVLRQGLDDFFGGITESSLVGLIEPVMIVFLGFGVSFLLASVLIPIYNISSAM